MTLTRPEFSDIALAAAQETADDPSHVGELLEVEELGDGLWNVTFQTNLPGYRGWRWVVTLAEYAGQVTVCESGLMPGTDALLAPAWIPWEQRVKPGDLEPAMVLPFLAEDERLLPGYQGVAETADEELAIYELGLGRERVLGPVGRDAAAKRWHYGEFGPLQQSGGATCNSCAFWMPLQGSMRHLFGVCANEWAPADGHVVSLQYGCGAHSQTDVERRASLWPDAQPLVDSAAVTSFDLSAEEIASEELATAPTIVAAEPEVSAVATELPADVLHDEIDAGEQSLDIGRVDVGENPDT